MIFSQRIVSAGRSRPWPAALAGALLLAALAAVASCGGEDTTSPAPPPPPPPPAAPVQVGTIPNQTVETGQTETLEVSSYFRDPDGGALTYTAASSAAGVVSVSVSGSTLTMVGVADGTATVTVTARDPGGLTAVQSFGVTVVTPNRAPEAVGTLPDQTVEAGQTATLAVSSYFRDPDGDALTYTVASSAPAVISVAMSGGTLTMVGVAEGAATVTVTARDPAGLAAAQSIGVTVTPPVPATVTVRPETVSLEALGDTLRLTADVRDKEGGPIPGAAVAWTSSNPMVATVDGSGLVTAAGNGTATVTATAGSVSASAVVTAAQRVASVAVTPRADTLLAGDTVRLSAEAYDANGHAVPGAVFSWSSSDESVATVDASGLVTGVAAGEAEIAAATAGGASGGARLTVEAAVPSTVDVRPEMVSLSAVGDTVRLAAEVRDQAGRPMPSAPVAWTISDPTVASVDVSGLVTATGDGTATVTATSGSASGRATVTVAQRAASVTVIPAADTIAPGESLQLAAEAFDANGHPVGGAEFAWTSSDPAIAGVTPSTGLVVALAAGNVTITATAGGVWGTAAITVANPDRAALLALYRVTGGPNWTNSENWLTDAPLRDWYGVQTDGSGRVVSLDLDGNALEGPIPPELGGLANLDRLRLDGNNLVGPIPSELADLTRLRTLNLYGNALEGPIPPELGRLVNLDWLPLGENNLVGPIPSELGNLAQLRILNLYGNALEGPIPPELGNLVNLESLSLGLNKLEGPIPQSFLQLDRLQAFYIGSDEGLCVPGTSAFFGWLEGIERRDGSVTLCNAADVSALRDLYAATGGSGWTRSDGWSSERSVEEWHGVGADTLGMVVALNLSDNSLTGEFPSSLANLAALRELRLTGNRLMGRLPLGFARLPLHTVLVEPTVCVPSEAAFQSWWATVPTKLSLPACAALSDRDVLVALYRAMGGDDWYRNDNWLSDEPLSMWYGVSTTTGSAGRAIAAGASSRVERPDSNAEGYTRDRVLDSASLEEELEVLRSRWNGTGSEEGADASPAAGWAPVDAATDGSVVALDLPDNGLTGTIPPEVGSLSELRRLDLFYNLDLSGAIPPELGNLGALEFLRLQANDLTGPIPPELGNLSQLTYLSFQANDLTGRIPPEFGNLRKLTELNLSFNRLRGPIPPELGNLRSLDTLNLDFALRGGQAGTIPPGLARLADASYLSLVGNDHTGEIPPELGRLANLRVLRLWLNALTGPIPPELGRLSSLEELVLSRNELSGPLPPELGNLASLEYFSVTRNRLSGQIPPELGRLSHLDILALGGNDFSGAISSQLQNLSRLREIYLWGNRFDGGFGSSFGNLPNLKVLYAPDAGLAGPLPPSFGRLAALEWLDLSENPELAGELPSTLTAIDGLVRLLIADTGLCAPDEPAFLAWLEGVTMQHGVAPCGRGIAADAYLVQAVQSAVEQVPLVAGREALLRVFVTSDSEVDVSVPPVRASFYRGGRLVHTADIAANDASIPAEPAEGSLTASSNAAIPAAAIRPGLEMVVEIDPEGTLDPALGIAKRIPASGRLPLDVREVPPFEVTVVPFLPRVGEDLAVLERLLGLTRDDPLFRATRARLPVDDLAVTVRSPVITSTNNMFELVDELEVVRVTDGAPGYYMGVVAGEAGPDGLDGVAFDIPSRSQMSRLDEFTIAHEFGHNLHLFHASCSGDEGGPDPGYPYEEGTIGAWGYDFVTGSLVSPGTPDFMSYCDPEWVSPYHFSNALRWRRESEARALAAQEAAAGRMLLLWGNADAGGVPSLDPSFLIEARPSLPDSAGDWRVSGEAEDGSELFSLDFHMPEVVDGDGRRSFVFAVPADSSWEGRLARIVLAGPGGQASMEDGSEPPMAILRDAATGQVRGFLRDPPDPDALARGEANALAAVGVDPDEIEVVVSRGVPDDEAWRR